MQPDSSSSFVKRLVATGVVALGWLLLGLATLSVVGTLFPTIPYLGMAGLVGSGFPLVFGGLPLLGGALVVHRQHAAAVPGPLPQGPH